jgi:hypothetical protein
MVSLWLVLLEFFPQQFIMRGVSLFYVSSVLAQTGVRFEVQYSLLSGVVSEVRMGSENTRVSVSMDFRGKIRPFLYSQNACPPFTGVCYSPNLSSSVGVGEDFSLHDSDEFLAGSALSGQYLEDSLQLGTEKPLLEFAYIVNVRPRTAEFRDVQGLVPFGRADSPLTLNRQWLITRKIDESDLEIGFVMVSGTDVSVPEGFGWEGASTIPLIAGEKTWTWNMDTLSVSDTEVFPVMEVSHVLFDPAVYELTFPVEYLDSVMSAWRQTDAHADYNPGTGVVMGSCESRVSISVGPIRIPHEQLIHPKNSNWRLSGVNGVTLCPYAVRFTHTEHILMGRQLIGSCRKILLDNIEGTITVVPSALAVRSVPPESLVSLFRPPTVDIGANGYTTVGFEPIGAPNSKMSQALMPLSLYPRRRAEDDALVWEFIRLEPRNGNEVHVAKIGRTDDERFRLAEFPALLRRTGVAGGLRLGLMVSTGGNLFSGAIVQTNDALRIVVKAEPWRMDELDLPEPHVVAKTTAEPEDGREEHYADKDGNEKLQIDEKEEHQQGEEETVVSSTISPEIPECAICMRIYVEGESRQGLRNCIHNFHRDCIHAWFTRGKLNCPICRAVIDRKK